MFIHHVFFTLKNQNNAADTAALIEGLETLRTISTIRAIHIGKPADTNRAVIDKSYDVSWLLIFDDAAGEKVYQDHPIHHAFIEKSKHLWEKVQVFDAVNV